jgi:nitrogenase molybdenum-iron protein NifN
MRCSFPLGIDACDAFFGMLAAIAERDIPQQHAAERRRLVDAYVDGHKFTAGRRVIVWGDEDFAPAIAAFVAETGLQVAAVAGAAPEKTLRAAMVRHGASLHNVAIIGDADFEKISSAAVQLEPDLLIGSGKGYQCARKLNIPFVRTGFPVHDRFGAQRLLHVGYEGTLSLYDRIVNTIIERRQDDSDVGYLCW